MRESFVIGRRGTLAGAALVSLGVRPARAQALDTVSFLTNWRAEAEHGGFYQAVASGIYKKHGISCDLRMGGPQQNPAQLLVAGRVDCIMSAGIQALNYARDSLPFLSVASIMQKDPQGLMVHTSSGIDSFEAMKGKPILVGAGGRVTYWPWLQATFGFKDEQLRPYTFNIGPFLADRNAIQQAFVTAEPYAAMKAGAHPRVLLFAEHGFANYQTTVDTSTKFATDKADVLQRFLDATMEGWALYMKGDDRPAADALIKKDNADMEQADIDYAWKAMNERGIIQSGDALTMGIGAMTDERWHALGDSMVKAGVFPAGLDVTKAYTLKFTNRKIGV